MRSLAIAVTSTPNSAWLAAKPVLKSTRLIDEDDLPDPQPVTARLAATARAQTSRPEITRARYRTAAPVSGRRAVYRSRP